MKIKVTKPFKQADPDPSKPHHVLDKGVHDVPDWLGDKAVDRGDAVAVKTSKKEPDD